MLFVGRECYECRMCEFLIFYQIVYYFCNKVIIHKKYFSHHVTRNFDFRYLRRLAEIADFRGVV